MSTVQLHELEGCLPLAGIGKIDSYFLEKGAAYAARSATLGGNIPVAPADIELQALRERVGLMQRQGVAPYVGALTTRLRNAVGEREGTRAGGLASTHLTDLFAQVYGVAIGELTQDQTEVLDLSGGLHPKTAGGGFTLNYGVMYEGRLEHFWQISAVEAYGFVNMFCPYTALPQPLAGQGNITFMRGVGQALTADTELLITGPR